MAILVRVNKVNSSKSCVTYSFVNEYGNEGFFDINPLTGQLDLTRPMPTDGSKTYFVRAARKVMTDWKLNGALPDHTVWAS
ncbi:hypothetical protein [Pantoea dispersa]|uniref:hypothetical protein n=1 Tax=Pantoea dispersa TaxID=59814 RepID=UPI001EE72D8C|nr:hypothetical protein [Pantoea dispersa]UKY36463.1 hypothetical protein KFZ74_19670 [Pantoea dispersa]